MYGVYSLGGFALLSIVGVRLRRRRLHARGGGVAIARRRRRGRSGCSSSRCSSPRRSAGRSARRCSRSRSTRASSGSSQRRRGARRNRVWIALPMLVALGEHARERRARRAARRCCSAPTSSSAAAAEPGCGASALIVLAPLAILVDPVRPGDDRALLPPPARRSAVRRTGDGVALARRLRRTRRLLRPPRDGDPDRRSGVAGA